MAARAPATVARAASWGVCGLYACMSNGAAECGRRGLACSGMGGLGSGLTGAKTCIADILVQKQFEGRLREFGHLIYFDTYENVNKSEGG